jgi:hypothetical protein
MNIQRILISAVFGAIAATVISWGGLYLFGTFILHGHGSLFDTNPTAANIFFVIWLTVTVVGAVTGGYVGHVSSKKNKYVGTVTIE